MRTFDSRIDVRVLYKTCTSLLCPRLRTISISTVPSQVTAAFCAKLKAVQRKRKFDFANERSTNYLLTKQQNKRR